jgi:4-alpha-glucanotransferase
VLSEQNRQHWSRGLPPAIVTRSGAETAFWVHVTHGDPAEVFLRLEDGTVRAGLRQADNFTPPFNLGGRLVGEATFVLPADLPLGYHRVHLRSGASESDTTLIVTPSWLGLPARMGARRAWGLATQLYSVTSAGSWGIGDLTDLADLAAWAGSVHGAGYVLVNPLHATAPTKHMEPSPYLPTSRRFVSPLYLRVEAIPEFAALPKRRRFYKFSTLSKNLMMCLRWMMSAWTSPKVRFLPCWAPRAAANPPCCVCWPALSCRPPVRYC